MVLSGLYKRIYVCFGWEELSIVLCWNAISYEGYVLLIIPRNNERWKARRCVFDRKEKYMDLIDGPRIFRGTSKT